MTDSPDTDLPAISDGPRIVPLDPASPAGIKAARDAGALHAAVIARLRREGIPVPGDDDPGGGAPAT
jgi:hypothetical protein